MGTSYYLLDSVGADDNCNDGLCIHIGKKSAGLRFLFRGHRMLIETREAWLAILNTISSAGEFSQLFIRDEYGTAMTADEMLDVISRADQSDRGIDIEFSDFS